MLWHIEDDAGIVHEVEIPTRIMYQKAIIDYSARNIGHNKQMAPVVSP
jgi:hypothetical protein